MDNKRKVTQRVGSAKVTGKLLADSLPLTRQDRELLHQAVDNVGEITALLDGIVDRADSVHLEARPGQYEGYRIGQIVGTIDTALDDLRAELKRALR